MKFSLSWLKRHLETTATLDEIVEAMVQVGLEVEEIDDPAERLKDFTIGEVLDAEPHPDADKLKVCRVATKDGEKQIVCGAPNARKGIKVAYAGVGTYVPGIDVTLSKAKIRGVESFGMMCSAKELVLGEDHDGIIEAPENAKVGQSVVEALGSNDPVIDFEVTPNRPDTNGVLGVARDLAAAGLGKLVTPVYEVPKGDFPCPQKVELDFPADKVDACPVFGGVLITNIENGPSPKWLKEALLQVGLRPINALVDVTNYISIDRARPLHVYDVSKISGSIRVRFGTGEADKFEALDGKEYTPDPSMTVITDDDRCLGLGGIMGGTYSGCTEETTKVFIECAYFDPTRTAKTGRKTGIISDARYRFERGVDPQSILPGLAQAVAMITEICGGEASEPVIAGQAPEGRTEGLFPPSEVKRLTGLDVCEDEMLRILTDLGFEVEKTIGDDPWPFKAPSYRPDIEGKADLVEEIARIVGFDAMQAATLPRLGAVEAPKYSVAQTRVRLAKRELAAIGYLEAVTWSFCDEDQAALFGWGPNSGAALVLANPISSDLGVMRPSILPGLIAALGRNADRGRTDLALFEVGPAYRGDQPDEQDMLAVGVQRSVPGRHWKGDAAQVDVFTAKADALAVLEAAGAPVANLMVAAQAPDWYHPGRSGVLKMGPKVVLAAFGEIHPKVTKAMDVEGPLYGFEVFLDRIPQGKKQATKTRPALNASDLLPLTRDFAFVVKQEVPAEDLLKAVRGAEKKLLKKIRLFDVYQGKGIEDGYKSLAVEVTLQPQEKTFTDEDIEAISTRIISQVAKATGGVLRA